jgi:phage baseplate assembly protein W
MSVFNVSRLGIAVNLPTVGTYDILLVTTPFFPVGAITFEYSKPTSAKITGIQKCAQFFLKSLLTTKGTDLLNPAYGTNLPSLVVGSNSTLNSQELIAQITSSVNDAVTQCKALLNDTTNDLASKLDSVTITSISTSTVDSLTLNLRLVTMAGEVGSLALPAPLLSTPVYNG